MYEIKVIDDFSGAHNLLHYKGKCEELHGHNWKVEVSVYSETLDKVGMVIDFKDVKDALRSVLVKLDHKYLNNIEFFKKHNPTSENIARFIHGKLSHIINKKIKITVWETERSSATYTQS